MLLHISMWGSVHRHTDTYDSNILFFRVLSRNYQGSEKYIQIKNEPKRVLALARFLFAAHACEPKRDCS